MSAKTFGIIDRYILRETLKSFLAILSVLMLILISHALMKLLQRIAEGRYSSEILLQMVGLESVTMAAEIAPPAFFFAILYSLGKMYRDSEMTALFAGGIGLGRIYRCYMMLAIPLTLLLAVLTLYVTPEVNQIKEQIKEQRKEQADLTQLPPGRFHETSDGSMTYYFDRLAAGGTQLAKIFVQNTQQDQLGLITAERALQYTDPRSGDRFIVLQDGYRYAGVSGKEGFSRGRFEEYGLRVEQHQQQPKELHRKAKPTLELIHSEDVRERSEFQWRVMLPLAVIVFTLVSIPLSRSLPREGIYGRLVLALLFYFIFVNVMAISADWMRSGVTPLWLGRWWVHPFILALTGLLLYLYNNPLRFRRRSGAGR